MSDVVERVQRAVFDLEGADLLRTEALDAIAAVLDAAEADGFVLVPKAATEGMFLAADVAWNHGAYEDADMYDAMLSAAPRWPGDGREGGR